MPTNKPEPGDLQPLASGNFSGQCAFSQLVRDALLHAAKEGWPEMVWADSNFETWPLHEKAVFDALHAWAGMGRKLIILAQRFDSIQRYQPRFVQWRTTWDHIIECRVCKSVDAADFPSALWSPVWYVRKMDLARCTGVSGADPQTKLALREVLEERRRQSSPGFPASILGL
jgi:hypothetical protein